MAPPRPFRSTPRFIPFLSELSVLSSQLKWLIPDNGELTTALALGQRSHIDHEAILHIRLNHSLIGLGQFVD
jgi:hypothetical protein